MIKTMAVKITEDTYPIAVACLPDGFVTVSKKCVLGSYLVINDLQPPDVSMEGRPAEEYEFCDDEERVKYPPSRTRYNRMARPRWSNLTLVNFWEPAKTFKKKFKTVGEVSDKTSFFEITRK